MKPFQPASTDLDRDLKKSQGSRFPKWVCFLLALAVAAVGWTRQRPRSCEASPPLIVVNSTPGGAGDVVWDGTTRPALGTSIQRALDSLPESGGEVRLGPGVFECDRPVVIRRSGVRLSGQGSRTLLRLTDKANCPLLIVGDPSREIRQTVTGVHVTDLTLDGNRASQSSEMWADETDGPQGTVVRNNCLTLRRVHDSRFERLVTRRGRSGGMVLEKGCRNLVVDELTSTDNEFDGLAGYETEDSVFRNLRLHGNRSAGISIDLRFNRNRFERAELRGNGSQGIFMRESSGNRFDLLDIADNGAQGIFIAQADHLAETACRDNEFRGLSVIANKGHGLRVNDVSCVGNSVLDSIFRRNFAGDISTSAENLLAISASTPR